jgi:DNA-binding XRE family transcriptional regulator
MRRNETMKKTKKERLEAAGWKFGSAEEFLGLTPSEVALIEIKLALARSLRELRLESGRTQSDIAKLIGSSQSRVAKMEAGDPSVSMDLLVRALLAAGASKKDLARIIGRRVA